MSDGQKSLTPEEEQNHSLAHSHGHHHHHHGHDHGLPVVDEAPLDPASQSLADALRSSFRILKLVMFGLLILFLFSGVFTVGTNEEAVVTRFGRQVGPPAQPGLHFAWPYPIDMVKKVDKKQKSTEIDAFWLRLSETDKTKDLTQVEVHGNNLDPATDGSVVTGDGAIMHILLKIQYKVSNSNDYVQNVSDEAELIRTTIQQSAVAEAARTTADVVWKSPAELITGIKSRTQTLLDSLVSGMVVVNVAIDSHYPLQVRDDFLAFSDAENRMRGAVQEANKKREETLKGAAGAAWEDIYHQIELLDQTPDAGKQEQIMNTIRELLTDKASGEAGKKIRLAEGQRDQIIAEAQGNANRFLVMLDQYRKTPDLVTSKLRSEMLQTIFSQALLPRWFLPGGGNKFIWINKNPMDMREIDRANAKAKVGK